MALHAGRPSLATTVLPPFPPRASQSLVLLRTGAALAFERYKVTRIGTKALQTPGIEPGFTRPQRVVLTVIRCLNKGLTGIRTLNLLLRRQAPYPLGHKTCGLCGPCIIQIVSLGATHPARPAESPSSRGLFERVPIDFTVRAAARPWASFESPIGKRGAFVFGTR
jgi:hypothetical protein